MGLKNKMPQTSFHSIIPINQTFYHTTFAKNFPFTKNEGKLTTLTKKQTSPM